jgi:uncharacterized protein (DUF1800 family)
MTLFWHNHFATSYTKAFYPYMFIQNQTLRRHALDRFDTLLVKMAQDPAMLIWLDGVTNIVGRPNENFARELQGSTSRSSASTPRCTTTRRKRSTAGPRTFRAKI